MKVLKWSVVIVVLMVVGIPALAVMSSYLSLDHDYEHTAETEALPLVRQAGAGGLVRIKANGYEFRARVANFNRPAAMPTVILLHGFPVTSAMWIPLIEPLAKAGFRVVAYDQRGYSPGARPEEGEAYQISHLVSDVVAVADAVGAERFHLVGHDWGAAVGWSTVLQHSDRIDSWTGLSIAHPAAFIAALQNDPDQQSRSGYFQFFSTPFVPETAFTFAGLTMLEGLYAGMGEEQASEYLRVLAEPGALTGALNWYRQMSVGPGALSTIDPVVQTPTLFIWGNNDPAVGRAAVAGQTPFIKGAYKEIELDAGHWLMASHAEQVVPEVVAHVRAYRRPRLVGPKVAQASDALPD